MSIPSDDMRGTQGKTTQDWTEDFNLENGRYQCLCIACGKMFYGHKRRSICKVCAAPVSSPSETEPSPASRSADALPSNIRRALEESNLPIEVATALADRLEARQPVGGEAGVAIKYLNEWISIWDKDAATRASATELRKAVALIEKLVQEKTKPSPEYRVLHMLCEYQEKRIEELKARLDAPCEEVHKKLDSLKLLSIEAAYAELADYARDLYRKWQEANRRAEYWKAEHLAGNKALEAAEQRAAEAVARDSLDTIERVCFYEQEFYVLSNFSAFNLVWRNIRFSTSEAAYHWEKFPHDEKVRAAILNAKSAHDAFKCAEHFRAARRPDWDAVKVGVMREILRAKAEQHEYVRRKLLETGNRLLVENSWRDDFWGWGPNKDGRNMLGKLWMEIRAELRATAIRARSEGGGNG